MTIAIILSKPPGYSETFFRSKIQGLLNHGHQVILVTGRTEDKFDLCHHIYHPKVSKNTAVQLFMMFKVFMGLLPYFKTVIRYIVLEKQVGTPFKRIVEKLYINAQLLQLKVDWIHFGFATMAIDRELVANAIGAKMAVSFRGYDINVYPIKNPQCYTLLWKQVDKVHSISNDLLQKAYNLGLSKSVPYQIITPAVNLEMLPDLKSIENPKTLKMLTIARLHYIKGIDVLLETAANLNKSHIDFTWEIIGSGNDNERYLYQRLRLGLEDRVVFLGELNHQDTLRKLQETNLYVQTSLTEGFCNAVLE
ncbi:MAG: glycosyltransferase, partial [Flavobacteriales bacterium]